MRWILLGLLLIGLVGIGVWTLRASATPQVEARLVGTENLQGPADPRYQRVVEPRAFQFPADHGPHPEYRTEWWYYTGNLESADGEHLGFQLTFFRQAVAPEIAERESSWATRQVYLAHFAMVRASDDRFVSFERYSRGAAGLAGAQGDPYRVWVEGWQAEALPGSNATAVRLHAAEGPAALDLTVREAKPLTLQGDRGLSQKSGEVGNASYYYSATRLAADGTMTLDGRTYTVKGFAWLDREWGTSALGENAVGWDWFALQLDDNREITFFQIRLKDGGVEPQSGGTLTRADGTSRRLPLGDVRLEVLDRWTSSRSQGVYPARWRLQVPAEGIDLEITPHAPDQELDVSIRYWEGAVRVSGTSNGHGYVEMTGYATPAPLSAASPDNRGSHR